jgi:hypothetical protein
MPKDVLVCHVMILLLLQAVELMQKRNYNAAECSRLVAQLLAYVLGRAPFCLECPSGMPVSDWWASMPDAAADVLKALATLLYAISPHAADPERLFSQLGFYEGQRRSGLAVDTLGMMATIKFRYNQQQPRYAYHLLHICMHKCTLQTWQLHGKQSMIRLCQAASCNCLRCWCHARHCLACVPPVKTIDMDMYAQECAAASTSGGWQR